jgi:hypothetical protein
VLVTPNGGTGTGNDGGDFGSKTPSTATNGIQEALNQISSSGGTVYICTGAYYLSKGVVNTGSNQVVLFEAGVVLNFTSTAAPINSTDLGQVWLGIASSYNDSSKVNFAHIYWFGNGCEIGNLPDLSSSGEFPTVFGLMQYGQYDGFSGNAGEDFIVDGFQIPSLPVNQLVWALGVDHFTTIPETSAGLALKIRNVRLSRLFAVMSSSTPQSPPSAPEMNVLQGAWHNVEISDCAMDASPQAGNYGDAGTLFVRANAGDSEQLAVRRCFFRGIANGEVVELQGCSTSKNVSTPRTCQDLYLEDCTVDSGGEFLASAIYINDANYPGTNTPNNQAGAILNIEFRRCTFINCGVTLNDQLASVSGNIQRQNRFGYIRFVDCFDGSGGVSQFPQISSAYFGALAGRYPMTQGTTPPSSNFTTVNTGVSSFTYVNDDAIDEIVAIWGGSSIVVTWNSVGGPIAGGTGTYRLRPGDSITVTYSEPPQMAKYGV